MNGKAIYNPSGKAGEYAEWACNFYAGCSNGCKYCYLTKGWSKKTYEHRYPKLKAGFRDEKHALEVFEKELVQNIEELRKHGLFFSFTTDPMLPETVTMTMQSVYECIKRDVPVKILTKRVDRVDDIFEWVDEYLSWYRHEASCTYDAFAKMKRSQIAVGFTLTGHDELEPNASTNTERIKAMQKLHAAGFKTWASIEPIVDIESSMRVIEESEPFCDHYKIGIMSGKKYDCADLWNFIEWVQSSGVVSPATTIYFKDSLLKRVGYLRSELLPNCVGLDYNTFNIK